MKYSVEELLSEGNARWDRRIAADLASEIEGQLGEKVDTIPEMRRLLAVKGYRELRLRLELDTSGHHGDDAIRAMAIAMRAFAHERPGLAAATFRSPAVDSFAWRQEGELLGATALGVFTRAGLDVEAGVTALRILRALVRGFVLHEMSASFLEGVDYDETYAAALTVFIRGLDAIRSRPGIISFLEEARIMRNYGFAICSADGTCRENSGSMALLDDEEAQTFGQQVIRDAMQGSTGYFQGWRMNITEGKRAVCTLAFVAMNG